MMKRLLLLLVCLCALLPACAEETVVIGGVTFSADGRTLIDYPADKTDEHYTVPEGVEVIGEAAFCGAEYLRRVTLPDSVHTICDDSFADCHALETVDLPDRMRYIGDMAFYQTGLTSVDLPEGITSIGWLAFAGASLQGTVVIPEGVTNIDHEPFVHQPRLLDLYLPSTLATIHDQPIGPAHCIWDLWGGNNWHDQDYQLVLHAPEGTAAAQFARQSGQPYVIEDARGGTDRAAVASWVQAWLDRELPGAKVCISRIDLPAVAYSADAVLAAVQLPDGMLTLCLFDRAGDTLTLRFRNDEMLSQAQTQRYVHQSVLWEGGYVPHTMTIREDWLTIAVTLREGLTLQTCFEPREGSWELAELHLIGDDGRYWYTPHILRMTEDMLAPGIRLETYAPFIWLETDEG